MDLNKEAIRMRQKTTTGKKQKQNQGSIQNPYIEEE
jgi:hypothetical protein